MSEYRLSSLNVQFECAVLNWLWYSTVFAQVSSHRISTSESRPSRQGENRYRIYSGDESMPAEDVDFDSCLLTRLL